MIALDSIAAHTCGILEDGEAFCYAADRSDDVNPGQSPPLAHRCESTATISAVPSPPDAQTSSSPTFSGFSGRPSLSQFQVPQLDRCGDDTPKAKVTLRSVAPTLPFE